MTEHKTITTSTKHYKMIKRIAEVQRRSIKNANELIIERKYNEIQRSN